MKVILLNIIPLNNTEKVVLRKGGVDGYPPVKMVLLSKGHHHCTFAAVPLYTGGFNYTSTPTTISWRVNSFSTVNRKKACFSSPRTNFFKKKTAN